MFVTNKLKIIFIFLGFGLIILLLNSNSPFGFRVGEKEEDYEQKVFLKESTLDEDKNKIKLFYNEIFKNEYKVFSQSKEDGVIMKLLEFINKTRNGFYVEFGTQQGLECNTRNLRENYAWKGLLMDGLYENLSINLHKEPILHSNILELFEKYKIEKDFDLLSEDTDYADYWIVEKILTKYRPKILVHEVNQQGPELCVTVPKPDKLTFWDGTSFHGANVCAFWCLAKQFDYTMVYCETRGVDCFWMRNDLLKDYLKIDISIIQNTLVPDFLFKKLNFSYPSTNKQWHQIKC